MEFELDPKRKMIQETVRKFSQTELAPMAAEIDEKEVFPRQAWEKIGKLKLAGLMIPKQYGGMGLDYTTLVAVMEELAAGCMATAGTYTVHIMVGNLINAYGNQPQLEKYLPGMAQGIRIGAVSITEANAGSDVAAMATIARLDGDTYVVNGSKTFVTTGGEADIYIIFLVTDEEAARKGISALIVEKGTQGFIFGKKEQKMAYGGSPTMELIFEDCRVPGGNLIGREGDGFLMLLRGLNGGRISIGAMAVGIARAAYEATLAYVRTKAPYNGQEGSHSQWIQWKLADMAIKMEASRWLNYRAAFLADMDLPFVKEASMSKCFATDTAMWVTNKAVEILGRDGVTKEFPVERYMREAKILQIVEGTNEIQRNAIAMELLRR